LIYARIINMPASAAAVKAFRRPRRCQRFSARFYGTPAAGLPRRHGRRWGASPGLMAGSMPHARMPCTGDAARRHAARAMPARCCVRWVLVGVTTAWA